MEESTSKEKILKKVRKALIHKSEIDHSSVDFESELYITSEDELEFVFAREFTSINGNFFFCETPQDLGPTLNALIQEKQWEGVYCFEDKLKQTLQAQQVHFSENRNEMEQVNVGITGCEFLIARTGSVMVSSKQEAGRRLPFYANYHIVIAYTSQLVFSVKEALKELKLKYGNAIPSMVSVITGPSRTADIEKTLVQGAHGPKEIYVVLIDAK